MKIENQPSVAQMIHEALEALGTPTANVAVREGILKRFPDTNRSTIQCHIILLTVNHASRVHYPQNQKRRPCNTSNDLLYRPERGKLEKYDPKRHGEWEIAENDDGSLIPRATCAEVGPPSADESAAALVSTETRTRLQWFCSRGRSPTSPGAGKEAAPTALFSPSSRAPTAANNGAHFSRTCAPVVFPLLVYHAGIEFDAG